MTFTDIKYAIRLLLKGPSFTLLTVLVLSGGLGISLYTFATLNTMIYGDLPVPEGDSIVRVGVGSWPNFEPLDAFELAALRDQAESIEGLGAFRESRARVGEPGTGRNLRTVESDWRIFEFSRTQPALGRGFVAEDGATGSEPVAVIDHQTWQSAYSGDPDVVGEIVSVNGRLTRIVGIMPEGYAFPINTQMWLPLTQDVLDPPAYPGEPLSAYARLRPGVSVGAVETGLAGILRRVRQVQAAGVEDGIQAVSVLSFQEESWGILGTVLFGVLNLLSVSILLLAAVNVGNLMLARTNERIVEVGVRVALGAPRFRLVVQTTLENLILCSIGGIVAVFLARRALEWTDGFLTAFLGGDLPFWWTWSLDGELLAAAGVFLFFTVLIVSVLPALCVSRADPNSLLRDGTRAGGGLSMGRISRGLVTVQVALISTVMIVGGVIVVLAQRAVNFDPGMDTDDVLTMIVEVPPETYATDEERLRIYEQVLAEFRAAPAIEAAAAMFQLNITQFGVEGVEYAVPEAQPGAWLGVLSESPTPIGPILLEGRGFDSSDNATGLRTAIVSETLARTHWPNESALGQRIDVSMGGTEPEQLVIVGIVADVGNDPLGMMPVGLSSIYVPLPQVNLPAMRFLVRHTGDTSRASAAMSEAVARIDPALVTNQISSFEYQRQQATLVGRTLTKLFAGSGAFAILLAVTGIYGMSSNAVVLKRHEIGLRRALGASNGNVLTVFLARGTKQLAIGLGLSVLLAGAVLAVVGQGLSIGGWTLGVIGASVLVIVSACVVLSIYLSVRRVLRLEPSAVLRHA
ncbi:MAG TPA: ABC transporter permease [Gammaproteobacteria bacterium]|nr:ABC transporter permease [Gammaproteobacteria bacterium]